MWVQRYKKLIRVSDFLWKKLTALSDFIPKSLIRVNDFLGDDNGNAMFDDKYNVCK